MSHPVITGIERQQRARHRVSIFLDGAFAFGVNDEVAYRFGLKKGMELTPELRREIERIDQQAQARLVAERFLAARLRTEKEVRTRLVREAFAAEIIDEVVEAFLRAGLIDDRAFAEVFVRDRLKFKPKSRSALKRELLSKGVSTKLVEETLSQAFCSGDELEFARQAAERQSRKLERYDEEERHRKLYAFLQRRGFSHDVIRAVLAE